MSRLGANKSTKQSKFCGDSYLTPELVHIVTVLICHMIGLCKFLRGLCVTY